MTSTTMKMRPSCNYNALPFTWKVTAPSATYGSVIRDASARTSDVSSYDCYSDNFERWLDSEAARRIANDNGNRTSFDDVMKELGLSYSDLEPVEIETDW